MVTTAQKAVVPWSPRELFTGGVQGWWYDPSDAKTLFSNSGGTTPALIGGSLGHVLDKSGNGNHLTQATSADQPTWGTANGLYYFQFSGSPVFMSSAATINLSSASSLGVAVAFTPTSTADATVMEFGPNTNSTNGTFYFTSSNDVSTGHISAASRSTSIGALETTSGAYGNGVTTLASCAAMDITQGTTTNRIPMRINGAVVPLSNVATGAAGTTYSTQTLYVGARAGSSNFFVGKIYGIIVRATPFTGTELGMIETWLGAKAGLYIP